jgi:hypothetical protein
MAANAPTRIDDDLFAAAKAAGAVLSRSAAQQVNHWARIGRQLEASSALSQRDIARVLRGTQSYDTLTAHEQAVVRADWDEQMTAVRGSLDFTSELTERGLDWAEADADGATVMHTAGSSPRRRPRPASEAAKSPAKPASKASAARPTGRASTSR